VTDVGHTPLHSSDWSVSSPLVCDAYICEHSLKLRLFFRGELVLILLVNELMVHMKTCNLFLVLGLVLTGRWLEAVKVVCQSFGTTWQSAFLQLRVDISFESECNQHNYSSITKCIFHGCFKSVRLFQEI